MCHLRTIRADRAAENRVFRRAIKQSTTANQHPRHRSMQTDTRQKSQLRFLTLLSLDRYRMTHRGFPRYNCTRAVYGTGDPIPQKPERFSGTPRGRNRPYRSVCVCFAKQTKCFCRISPSLHAHPDPAHPADRGYGELGIRS